MKNQDEVDTLYLAHSEVKEGDIVHHFPDPLHNLKFKIVPSDIELHIDYVMLEYIEHPLGKFIGNQREWPKENTFIIHSQLVDLPEWVKPHMSFIEGETIFLTEDSVSFACPTCHTRHKNNLPML